MPATQACTTPDILVIGLRLQWPPPLGELVAQGRIHLHRAADLHQAAARLSNPPSSHGTPHAGQARHYHALLVDPDFLSTREINLLPILMRHVLLPIWSLPSVRNREEMLSRQGILPWKEALNALAQVPPSCFTPQIVEGSNKISQTGPTPSGSSVNTPLPPVNGSLQSDPAKSHNSPPNSAEKPAKMPVVSQVTPRYDALNGPPPLSEHELRSLLGSPAHG